MSRDEFEEVVRQMRIAQRAFFASAQGSAERRRALMDSKALEQRVDNYLAGIPNQEALSL